MAALNDRVIAGAYVYLFGRILVTRREHVDRKQAYAAYNRVKCNAFDPAVFANANPDIAYLEAMFTVDEQTPVLLEAPQIEGRYYAAQILDEHGDVIVDINERDFPSQPHGAFALIPPERRQVANVDRPSAEERFFSLTLKAHVPKDLVRKTDRPLPALLRIT